MMQGHVDGGPTVDLDFLPMIVLSEAIFQGYQMVPTG